MKLNLNLLLIPLMLIGPALSQAGDLLDQGSDLTYFYQLIMKFNDANPVTDLHEILGWNSGRCYNYRAPVTPLGNLLIGVYADNDNGPMFPPHDIRFAVGPDAEHALPANRFDNLTQYDEDLINELIKTEMPHVKTEKKDQEWVSLFPDVSYHVRKLGSYYIVLLKINRDVDHINSPKFPLNKGDVASSCYFFKKIK